MEVRRIIERLQHNTRSAVQVMENGRNQARFGMEQAEQANVALQSIIQAVEGINHINAQIAVATEQQSAVAEEINRNIHSFSLVAEETAEGARRNAERSEYMARLAAQLQGLVRQFRLQEEH